MNIAIIGVGGVGGYFGGKLTQLLATDPKLNIYFVARNAHLKEIQENGLLLDTDDESLWCKPTLATDAIADLPPLDICLLCVKSYDLEIVLQQLIPKLSATTLLLPLLNGVDIYERIRAVTHCGVVLPACAYVGTHVERPGKVTQRGGSCTIYLGNASRETLVPQQVLDLFEKAQIKYVWLAEPYVEIWSKFMFIAAFGLVTATQNKTLGEVLQSAELSQAVKDIMAEIYQIAVKKQIPLPVTIVQDAYAKGQKFPFDTKTSFQRDYELPDKPDERDLFGGAIIRLGQQVGVPTKTTQHFYSALQKAKPKE